MERRRINTKIKANNLVAEIKLWSTFCFLLIYLFSPKNLTAPPNDHLFTNFFTQQIFT